MSRRALWATLVAMSVPPLAAASAPIAEMRVAGAEVQFEALVGHAGAVLTVATPAGDVVRLESARGIPAFGLFDPQGQLHPDGLYRWELRLTPRPASEPRRAVESSGEHQVAVEQLKTELGRELVQSGSFTIAGGSFVDHPQAQPPGQTPASDAPRSVSAATQVINDDLMVRDLTPWITFDDTGPAGFPANDWRLTANEWSGLNKFSIEDVTGIAVPFTILAGAYDNSIFVDDMGQIGLGTAIPEASLHVRSGAPVIRLEGSRSQQLPPQAWDLQGGHTFGVEDVTGGETPLRIVSGAPTNSLAIDDEGDVGLGTLVPASKLHVRSDGAGTTSGKVLIENISAVAAGRELLELQNDTGQATMIFKNSTEAERWVNGTFSTSFVINNQAVAGVEYTFGNTGNFTAAGTITPGSSRTLKQAFAAIEPREILSQVLALPITSWSYKADPAVRHIGPMAEDFFAAFAVGADANGISVTDSAGVTLAAVQALHEKFDQALGAKDAQIAALQQRLAALETMVAGLAGN